MVGISADGREAYLIGNQSAIETGTRNETTVHTIFGLNIAGGTVRTLYSETVPLNALWSDAEISPDGAYLIVLLPALTRAGIPVDVFSFDLKTAGANPVRLNEAQAFVAGAPSKPYQITPDGKYVVYRAVPEHPAYP